MRKQLVAELRGMRMLVMMDPASTERDRNMAKLLGEAATQLEAQRGADTAVVTAVANVLLSQKRATSSSFSKYWTADRKMHDAGIDGLRALYPLIDDDQLETG